jgi:hypothetical protein
VPGRVVTIMGQSLLQELNGQEVSLFEAVPTDIACKLHLVMTSSGMIDKGRHMYSYLGKGVSK